MNVVTPLFGKEAPVIVNEQGGMQSKTAGAFYQLPARAIKALRTTVIMEPRTYDGHISAAWSHVEGLLADDPDGNHLRLALAHLAWAYDIEYEFKLNGGNYDFNSVAVCNATYGDFPASALAKIAEVMDEGAKRYARGNWRNIPYWSQVDHAVQHLTALSMGDDSDDHIGHAITRLAFAIEVEDADYRFTAIEMPKPKVETPLELNSRMARERNHRDEFLRFSADMAVYHHLAFSVGDVDSAIRALRTLGDEGFATLCDAMVPEFERRGLPDNPVLLTLIDED